VSHSQSGTLLAQANMQADLISKINGIKGMPEKVPIIAMIIQNLHEALLAYDQGVDVTGAAISPAQIGAGLKQMLNYMLDNGQWAKLQEGLADDQVNKITKLTGMIRASANALLSEN
jgi:hypothetical protein